MAIAGGEGLAEKGSQGRVDRGESDSLTEDTLVKQEFDPIVFNNSTTLQGHDLKS